MRKILIAAAAAFMLAAQAGAVCTSLGSGLGLKLPNYGDRGDVWAKCVRDNFQAMNDGLLPSTAATSYVLKSAPSLTGGLLSTSWANFVSSVTAGAGFYGTFYGSGANLSGVVTSTAVGTYPHSISGNAATATTAGTATNNVLKAGDNMTGQLTTASSMTAQAVMLNNTANPSLTFKGNNANNGGEIYFKQSADTTGWSWKLWHSPATNNKLYLYRRGPADEYTYAQTWMQNGNVGIGSIDSPTHKLYVNGGIYAVSSITANAGFYGSLTGSVTGNAATASALAADPTDCSLPNVALGVNASGTAVCGQPSNVTGTAANITGNLAAAQVAAGSLGASVIASSIAVGAVQDASIVSVSGSKVLGNISGNAATVTNGVYTTGSYSDPAWLTKVATSKVDLSTITTALAGKLDYPVTRVVSLGSYGLTTSSDVVAHAYYGDGSHLTGITGGGVQVATAALDSLPIGTFINYGSTVAPAGYLYCNGVNYSTTTYADLFNVIGYKYSGLAISSGPYFTCDFRGMFSRGVDELKLRDSEYRVIGSTEADKMQGHIHVVGVASSDPNVAKVATSSRYPDYVGGYSPTLLYTGVPSSDGTNGTPRTGPETRPMNVAVAVMVKYANVASVNISSSIITNGQANVWTGGNTFTGSVTVSSLTATGSASFTSATSTVTFGGWVDIGLEYVTVSGSYSTVFAACPAGKRVLSCRCALSTNGNIMKDCGSYYPVDSSERCHMSTVNTDAVALSATCARIK